MKNPVFASSAVFGDKTDRAVSRTQGQLRSGAATSALGVGATGAGADGWGAPQSRRNPEQPAGAGGGTAASTRTMTIEDVIVRTSAVFLVLVAVGVVGWHYGPQYPALLWVGVGGGLVLGLINAFKRQPSAGLILAYGACEGLFLGAVSAFYEASWPGIVVQAVLATLATFVATLLLFRSGKVRVTPKFSRWLMIAVGGYALFSLLNLVLVLTGALDGWGLRNGPFGVIIGLVAVGLAAACLIVDFDSIARGVQSGAPVRYAWAAAFGLVVTLVWLYLELLRLLAILRR